MNPAHSCWPGHAVRSGLLCLLLWAWCLQAQAAVSPTESVGLIRTVFTELTGAIDRFTTGNAGLISIGRRAAVALFGVLLVWGIVRSWILGQGFAQLVPEFIQPVIMLGLTLWAVDHLGPVVKTSVEGLSGVFAETLSLPGGAPAEMVVLQRLAGAGLDIIVAKPTHGGAGWVEAMKAFADDMFAALIRCLAAVLLLAAGVLAAGVMVLAKIQTAIAVLFAPVMIPWAMWKPTTFLFNSWLTFLITGAMQSVMAAAIAALSVTMVDKVLVLAQTVRSDDKDSYVMLCVIVVLATLILFLFTRVSSLASGLIGGSTLDVMGWVSTVKALVPQLPRRGPEGGGKSGGKAGPGASGGSGGSGSGSGGSGGAPGSGRGSASGRSQGGGAAKGGRAAQRSSPRVHEARRHGRGATRETSFSRSTDEARVRSQRLREDRSMRLRSWQAAQGMPSDARTTSRTALAPQPSHAIRRKPSRSVSMSWRDAAHRIGLQGRRPGLNAHPTPWF